MYSTTRRSLLGAGAAAVAGFAGCSSDTDTQEPGTPTSAEPSSLSIERTQLCAEQPTGYRQCAEQPDGTFQPDSVVWVYLEPSTVGTEPAGEGEVQFEYDLTWTVSGPDGAEIGTTTETVDKTVPEAADLSEVFVTVSVTPPVEFDPGTHRIDLDVTDTIAGTEAATSVEFQVASGEAAFSIGHVRFLDSEPTGYREYTENPDAAYGPQETIWLYLEPNGSATETQDGQRWYEFEVTVRTTGPDGDEEMPVRDTIRRPLEEQQDADAIYLFVSFDLPRPTAGEHTVDVTVTDRIAGERASADATFRIEDETREFSISHVRFLDSEPTGYREYTENPDAAYGPRETIWLYLEPNGTETETQDGQRWHEFEVAVRTTGPDGDEEMPVRDTIRKPLDPNQDPGSIYLAASFDLRQPSTGEYDAEITVKDRIAGERASADATFRIEEPSWQAVFRQVLREETDVQVDRLARTEGTVRLVYRTQHEYNDEEFNAEVGYIAGAYAGLLDEGLQAERLRVTGSDAADTEFVFEVEAETALAWIDGEISRDEYTEHVFDSLRRRR